MQALSIKQPWANLIVSQKKTIEVRRWSTNYRGDLLIHVSISIDKSAKYMFDSIDCKPLGVIIAIAKLENIKIYNTLSEFNQDYSKHLNPINLYQKGLFGFMLSNVCKIIPIPYKGSQKIFNTSIEMKDIKVLHIL